MASDRIYNDIKSIPYNDVGLLLGTDPQTRTGKTNSFFYIVLMQRKLHIKQKNRLIRRIAKRIIQDQMK